jgi:hypothetical protein
LGVKKQGNSLRMWVFILALAFSGAGIRTFADTEIDLGDLAAQPTPTAVQKLIPATAPALVATPTPASEEIQMEDNAQPETQTAPGPTPTVFEVQGREKMKDMYEAGIKYYKEQDYDSACRYLINALKMKNDPYTPKYIYAEANAMLGIIYQYRIIHLGRAYWYYKAALHYEPHNLTARRHIKQVYKYRNRKD